MKKEMYMEKLVPLIQPIVKAQGCELYHIEFVKEQGEYYLRIYIDSPQGITLQDCERVSRPVSDMLDVEDPIVESYYLEVSSPGIYRTLYTDAHLDKYKGCAVTVKLEKLLEGKKVWDGKLLSFDDMEVKIERDGNEFNIPREKIISICLAGEM